MEYEGEYLFDKKCHGRGYDINGNVIYKLINGNGKVKEYSKDFILVFEGEYSNYQKNGKGKEYNNYWKLIIEGEFFNGIRRRGRS